MQRVHFSGGFAAALWTSLFLLAISLNAFAPSRAAADDALKAKHLVEKAELSFENFLTAKEMASFRNLLKGAKGILISPQVLEGAFIVGASGGSGVFFARDPQTGQWAGPAFYTMGEASFGFQAGGKASEIILLAMTNRGVTAFLGNNFKLGADIGVAMGPVGAGAAAATANLSADILSFARSKGLYGGVSVEGAVVTTRSSLNNAYYGRPVTPTDILIRHEVSNPHAQKLIQAITKATTP